MYTHTHIHTHIYTRIYIYNPRHYSLGVSTFNISISFIINYIMYCRFYCRYVNDKDIVEYSQYIYIYAKYATRQTAQI